MRFSLMYVVLHVGVFRKIYTKILRESRGKRFVWLFNVYNEAKRVDCKYSYDPETSQYKVSGGKDRRLLRFFHERQANMAYARGITERGDSLGKDYFLDKINFKNGDVVLDCGANVGDLLLWFQNRGLEIEYVGFEPSPNEYECLKENVHPHKAHNVGLWNERKKIEFYVSSQGADSSIIEPIKFDQKISIDANLLSDYVDKEVKLLKLEAEGAEPEILEGLGDKIKFVEFISADLGYERGKNAESTLVPVTNFLLKRNFSLLDVSHSRICALYRNNNMA